MNNVIVSHKKTESPTDVRSSRRIDVFADGTVHLSFDSAGACFYTLLSLAEAAEFASLILDAVKENAHA